MKNFAYWALVHATHWALLYFAFVANIEGAMYVLKFFTWVMAFASMLLLVKQAIEDGAKKPEQPIRGIFGRLQSWVTLLAFVWFGHFATGLAWGWAMVMVAIHRENAKKARNSLKIQQQPMHHPV